MGMPASGTIALKGLPVACGSVGCGVCSTSMPATVSLCSISIAAGKVPPHSMQEFYNFCRETSWKCVEICNFSETGANNTASVFDLNRICLSSSMVAGQCYDLTLCHFLCSGDRTGGYSCVCVYCNAALVYSCGLLYCNPGVNAACTLTMTNGDNVCVCQMANHGVAGLGTCLSCSRTCITTIGATLGLFCKTGTNVSDCTVYSCL